MRLPLKKFLTKLGVSHILSAYETQPWYYYDEKAGLTCSAEVRMGPEGDDVEAEVQFLKDPDHEDEGEDDGSLARKIPAGGRAQIMYLQAKPTGLDAQKSDWAPTQLRIKGKQYANEMHNWEGKGCDFFIACIQSMSMEEIPDVDMLVEKNMIDESKKGGSSGRIGRKSPKIKPAQVMGMGKKP